MSECSVIMGSCGVLTIRQARQRWVEQPYVVQSHVLTVHLGIVEADQEAVQPHPSALLGTGRRLNNRNYWK